jgi:hypothetical protein
MATGVIRSALGVIVLALAFAACGSPTPSAPKEQIGRNQDGTFGVEIRTPKDTYRVADAIPIVTNVVYLGPNGQTPASSDYPSFVSFGLEQLDGPLDMPFGGSDLMCSAREVVARQPIAVPYAKSGGWSNNDPAAGFWQAFFADKELHLPVGTWRVIASLRAMTTPDCSGAKHEFDATVTFRVQG